MASNYDRFTLQKRESESFSELNLVPQFLYSVSRKQDSPPRDEELTSDISPKAEPLKTKLQDLLIKKDEDEVLIDEVSPKAEENKTNAFHMNSKSFDKGSNKDLEAMLKEGDYQKRDSTKDRKMATIREHKSPIQISMVNYEF